MFVLTFYLKTCSAVHVMFDEWLYYVSNSYQKAPIETPRKVLIISVHWGYASIVFSVILGDEIQ